MKKILMAAMLCSAVIANGANPPVEIPLWADGAPNDNGLPATAEVEGDNSFVMEVSQPVLYVFPASNPNGTAIVMLPGGAYLGLAMGHEGFDMAEWFNDMGVTYAVLKYRMPVGHSDIPLSDAEEAMRIVRSRAQEWGVNPTSVGVMGASAGGHLATTLATQYSSAATRPDFQILFYPVVSMSDEITHFGSREALLGKNITKADIEKFSNEKNVTADTPKAFIMVSADDDAVPLANTLRYYEALTNAGVMSALHIYPFGGHGWGFHDNFPYKADWTKELHDWMRLEIFKPTE
ncbi:MAG: alpha/beta hydrolase [Muribaculaceae bacterium]|nr:alpha/beta hydrolase [Muribaculaceae bacterium]